MTFDTPPARPRRCLAIVSLLLAIGVGASAAEPPRKPAAASKKPPARKPAKPSAPALPEASPEQVQAAGKVYYGHYECELGESIDIAPDPKNAGYVDVRWGKSGWRMKPVLSTTGAVRLEDVKGATLMVQIASKSMLMNVKAGRRLVDACVSPAQRELIEAAEKAKAADAAASAASSASAAGSAAAASASAAEPAAPTPSVADAASAPPGR